MKTYARPSNGLCATAVVRLSAVSLAVLVMFCLASTAVFAQCTLTGTVSTWTDGNSNWLNALNWNNGVPNSTTSACITDGTSTVTLDTNQTLSTLDLQIGSGNTLTSGTERGTECLWDTDH